MHWEISTLSLPSLGGRGRQPELSLRVFRGAVTRYVGCAAVLFGLAFSANAATADSAPVAPAMQPWVAYLQQLRLEADHTAAVRSAEAGVKANEASVDAQTGDRDLFLKLGVVDYPNGAGTGENGSFTDLDRRGEARLSWNVLDFFGRRPGRIASAEKHVDMAHAGVALARQTAMQQILQRSVQAWSAAQQRKALGKATQDLEQANQALVTLHRHALTRKLSDASAQAGTQVLQLQAKITQATAQLPIADSELPSPPAAYAVLPTLPPSAEIVRELAKQSPQAALLKAEAEAFTAQERAHWAENFRLDIYGGYVMQDVRSQAGTQSGPEVGLGLTVPIGGGGRGLRANAHWQARQQALAAESAIQEERRVLEQTRRQWSQAVANLKGQTTLIQHMAEGLDRMARRSTAGAGPQAPERWQLRLARARFWIAVADAWNARAQWIDSALTWSLYDGGRYLRSHPRAPGNGVASGLCAPLPTCPQI